MKKIRKVIIKDDLSTNPPKSGKKLKTRPPLGFGLLLPKGLSGSDLKAFKEGKKK